MFRTLHGKLSLALLALLVPVGIFYVWSTVATSQRYAQEVSQKVGAGLAARLVQEHDLMVGRDVDAAALASIIATLSMTNPGVDLYLLSPTGEILRASPAPSKVGVQAVSLHPIEAFLGGSAYPILGDNPRVGGGPKIFSVSPIPVSGPLEGYLYIVLADERQDWATAMVRSSTILRLSVWVGLAGLVLVFSAGTLIFTLFTRRLKRLAAVMLRFQEGNFTTSPLHLPDTRFGDEVDDLTRVFYKMSGRIAEQVTTLRESDQLRRELVENVSHDLRTPLTALQGYLETLQLSTLSEADKGRYLDAALKQSTRLGRLVGELFELAKLEANVLNVHQEMFSLAELLQDVVGEFQLAAHEQGVKLSADLRVTPFVRADVGLIERTLQNLLENALKHTPRGGTVTVRLDAAGDAAARGATVTVKDTGAGIVPEALPHIFERYYRAPHETPTENAGLGLAIGQRTLELHGSRLEVVSTLGVGTSFSFTLPTV